MPGIGDMLFGSEPSVSNNSFSNIDPTQLSAENAALNAIQTKGANPTPFTGELSPGLSGSQGSSLAAIEQMALPFSSSTSNDANLNFLNTTDALRSMLAKGPTNTDQAFSAIAQPVTRAFNTQVIPGLETAFGGSLSGTNSSGYAKAVDNATNDLTTNLSNAAAGLSLQSQENFNNNVIKAGALAPGLVAAPLQGAEIALNAGAVPQQTQGAQDAAAYNEFLRLNQTDPQQYIQDLLNLRNFGTTGMNSVVNPGSPGLVNSFLSSPGGSALAGAGIGSALGAGSFSSLLPLFLA